MTTALVLTYHSVGDGPRPLAVPVALFARHVEAVAASGARVVTVGDLPAILDAGTGDEHLVALTFDDGFADTVDAAAPVLDRHGLVATVFAVSGRLGGTSDWPSQPSGAPRLPLAGAEDLTALAARGWEIGSHSVDHDPLAGAETDVIELCRRSRLELEDAVGCAVRSFAYPYGVVPPAASSSLAAAGYAAACTTRIGLACPGADPYALPRVDAHYLRDPDRLAAVLEGRGRVYLAVRTVAARARRLVVPDHRRSS